MHRTAWAMTMALLLTSAWVQPVGAYPIDGYSETGIRRLERLRLISAGQLPGPMPPPGGRKPSQDIRLHLTGEGGTALNVLPAPDPVLQQRLESLFPDRHESYAVALLEITPGRAPRFAARQVDRQFSPGSVGKLAIAAGLFEELRRLYPDDVEKRKTLLRSRLIAAGAWIQVDHHTVPIYDPGGKTFVSREIKEGDVFSLYEWTDHMLSASANAAASTVWKEMLLMRRFGPDYPPDPASEEAFFRTTPKDVLRDMAMSTVNDPLRAVGIGAADWQLGSSFTSTGKRIIPGGGKSQATPAGMLAFLVALEQGRVVDPWSSLEIKRLMYMTARRIRYASSPALNDAAVYFKSGSLYRCKPEPDFKCGKYMGNVENTMNSVSIVEHPDGRIYLVVLMSNVLRKNSAVEHQSLATFIDRMLSH